MIAQLFSSLFLVLPAVAPPAAGSARAPSPDVPAQEVPAQDAQEKPDNREDVKQLLDELKAHAGERGREDQEAIAVIDRLVQLFDECGPKDRAAVVKGLDKCFKEKRQEDENGVRANQLYMASATALGEMAPESVPVLLSWIGHKSHRKDVPLQRMLIQKLGKTRSEKAMKPLLKLLDDHDPQIQGATAEALGEYEGATLKERKEVFEELLKVLMGVKNAVDTDPTDPIARERYDTIAAPIITSLQRLSGHNEHDPQEWQHWWNKNKKEDWAEPAGS